MKRRRGETERGRNGEKKKLTDSPIPRFPDSPIRFQTGFSLLEVMVAVVVLGFGLLAIMHLFPIGLRASKISQDTTTASFLAQQKIEGLKNVTFTGGGFADGVTTEGYDPPIQITVDKVTYSYPGFKRVTTIQTKEADEPILKRITTEVFYKPYGGERSVKLVTLRTNYKKTMKK